MAFLERISVKWKIRSSIVFFGLVCGIGYQYLKMERGESRFWDNRLSLAFMLGILLFYVINYVSGRVFKLFLGRYDASIQIKDMTTYLPLCLILFFPIQKIGIDAGQYGQVFLPLLGLYAFTVIVMKLLLIEKIKKGAAKETSAAKTPSIGNGWLSIAALVVGVPLFWFHQLTLSFEVFWTFCRPDAPEAVYIRHNDVTRKTFLYDKEMDLRKTLPYERSRAIVSYKIIKGPQVADEYSVPMNFDLRVTDDRGTTVAEKRLTLDATKKESGEWHDVEFDLPGGKGSSFHFRLKAKPAFSPMAWNYLRKFLFHNPLDFPYFQDLAVHVAWSEPAILPQEKERTNVILILLDTLRADYLGCYGYERDVSPTIDAFARENILFKNAFSQSSWTLPSHLSLLTGVFPNEFRKLRYLQWGRERLSETNLMWIDSLTLPEILNNSGYYCAAFTDGAFVSSYYGFYKGFHVYDEKYGIDGNSFELAKDWIAKNEDKDFFVFIHTYFVHDYPSETTLFRKDSAGDDSGKLLESIRRLFPEIENPENLLAAGDEYSYAFRIKLVDSYIQDFFSFLRKENLYDDTMIIITSDHGNSFGEEHNNGQTVAFSHGRTPPYDPEIHVPLIFKLPSELSRRPLVVDDDVRLLDIAPTILAVLGHDAAPQFRGRIILPGLESENESAYPFVYATWAMPGGAIRENGKKYIFAEGASEEFYNLANDPNETRNIASLEPDEMLEIKEKYNEFVAEMGKSSITLGETIDDAPSDLREKLRALGYLN